MALMDMLRDAGGDNVDAHFDRVAQAASPEELGAGVADAMRSDQTPPFGDMVGQLFGRSSPGQQAGLLNQILAGVGPSIAASLAGGALGRMLHPGQQQITPDQAAQVSPSQVSEIARHAEQHRPEIVDQVGRFYAQHSDLVKTLGGVALTAVLAGMRNRSR
jgi:hypothetical protein